MKRVFGFLLVLLFSLAACEQATLTPTVIKESPTPSLPPSQTPIPSQTPSPTQTQATSTPKNTLTPSLTPTGTLSEWTETYPTKQILIFYGAASNTQISAIFEGTGGNFDINPFLILYTDGQLILYPGYEKQLSQTEMDDILTIFERLGFFQIESTYPIDEQNPIYAFPNGNPPNPSGLSTVKYIEVNGQKSNAIGYMADWADFLIQPVKDSIAYLESFSTEGAMRYQPDRLLVASTVIPEVWSENQTIIPLPNDITPPIGLENGGVFYIKGNEATKFYNMLQDTTDVLFQYKDINLWLVPRPIYPHECPTSRFVFHDGSTFTYLYYFCEDP